MTADERNFGYSAAHEVIPVPLLPSGPGGVRGTSSHRARSSTHRQSRHETETAKKSSTAPHSKKENRIKKRIAQRKPGAPRTTENKNTQPGNQNVTTVWVFTVFLCASVPPWQTLPPSRAGCLFRNIAPDFDGKQNCAASYDLSVSFLRNPVRRAPAGRSRA